MTDAQNRERLERIARRWTEEQQKSGQNTNAATGLSQVRASVTAIELGTGRVQIRRAGSLSDTGAAGPADLPYYPTLGSYVPTVGDEVVAMEAPGGTMFVMGAENPQYSPPPPPPPPPPPTLTWPIVFSDGKDPVVYADSTPLFSILVPGTITAITYRAKPPTGSALWLELWGGSTVGSEVLKHRGIINAGQNIAVYTGLSIAMTAGQFLYMWVEAVGSTYAGGKASATCHYALP